MSKDQALTLGYMKLLWNHTSQREWNAHCAHANAAIQQDWAFGAALEALNTHVLRAEARLEDGSAAALAQFTVRRVAGLADWALCARGPVWLQQLSPAQKAEIYRALRKQAPLKKMRAVFFSPDEPENEPSLKAARLRRVMTGYATATIDLSQSLDALMARQHQKWRNRLRSAQKGPLRVKPGAQKAHRLQWLLEAEEQQQKDRKYEGHPPAMVPHFQLCSQDPSAVSVFEARKGREVVAAMLFLRHGRSATYQIGWAGAQGKANGAHNLVLWEACKSLKAQGVRLLDLGGVATDVSPGLARFKLGSGAQPVVLAGTYI